MKYRPLLSWVGDSAGIRLEPSGRPAGFQESVSRLGRTPNGSRYWNDRERTNTKRNRQIKACNETQYNKVLFHVMLSSYINLKTAVNVPSRRHYFCRIISSVLRKIERAHFSNDVNINLKIMDLSLANLEIKAETKASAYSRPISLSAGSRGHEARQWVFHSASSWQGVIRPADSEHRGSQGWI